MCVATVKRAASFILEWAHYGDGNFLTVTKPSIGFGYCQVFVTVRHILFFILQSCPKFNSSYLLWLSCNCNHLEGLLSTCPLVYLTTSFFSYRTSAVLTWYQHAMSRIFFVFHPCTVVSSNILLNIFF